jgi:CheY-like chemotaxis protein
MTIAEVREILLVSAEPSLYHMMISLLEIEEYPGSVTQLQTAEEAMAHIQTNQKRYVVIMDNYQNYPALQRFAQMVFAEPAPHERIKVVGLTAHFNQGNIPFDHWLALPFSAEQFIDMIEQVTGWTSPFSRER